MRPPREIYLFQSKGPWADSRDFTVYIYIYNWFDGSHIHRASWSLPYTCFLNVDYSKKLAPKTDNKKKIIIHKKLLCDHTLHLPQKVTKRIKFFTKICWPDSDIIIMGFLVGLYVEPV